MAPPVGRLAGPPKHPVQVRLSDEDIALIDTFAAELSRRSYGANFSRAEGLKLAAMAWLRTRYSSPPATSPPRGDEAAPGHSLVTEPDTTLAAPGRQAPQPRAHGLPRAVLERIAAARRACAGMSLSAFAQHLHDAGIYSATALDGSRRPVHRGNLKKWLDHAHEEGLL